MTARPAEPLKPGLALVVLALFSIPAACASNGAPGADAGDAYYGPGTTTNLNDDCAKLCRLRIASPTCAVAATCDGGCPGGCMTGCTGTPIDNSVCDSANERFVRCLANAQPFLGCAADGYPFVTHCESELAAFTTCQFNAGP